MSAFSSSLEYHNNLIGSKWKRSKLNQSRIHRLTYTWLSLSPKAITWEVAWLGSFGFVHNTWEVRIQLDQTVLLFDFLPLSATLSTCVTDSFYMRDRPCSKGPFSKPHHTQNKTKSKYVLGGSCRRNAFRASPLEAPGPVYSSPILPQSQQQRNMGDGEC